MEECNLIHFSHFLNFIHTVIPTHPDMQKEPFFAYCFVLCNVVVQKLTELRYVIMKTISPQLSLECLCGNSCT